MRVAFAAVRSSPGVTTAALAFASVWPGRVLLVEASEDGGALAVRFGLPLEPGLATLAAATRHQPSPEALLEHAQPLPDTDGRVTALVAPPTAEAAATLFEALAVRLDRLLRDVGAATVLVDAGRLGASPPALPLVVGADRVVLVARPRVEELQTLAFRLPTLTGLGLAPQLLLIGSRPYGPDEIADTLGVPVLGVLPDDPQAAEALAGAGSPRVLGRSALLRSAGSLTAAVAGGAATAEPSTAHAREAVAGSRVRRLWSTVGGAR